MTGRAVERPAGWRGLHYRLYDWVLAWSAHRRAQPALFLMSLAEASFFPIPPDVLLISMTVARTKLAARYALIASVGSVIGGLIGYGIGWGLWEATSDLFYRYIPGFSPEIYERVSSLYDRWDFWVVFTAGFTPIPFKVFTIGAGAAHINLAVFFVASAISRSARFFIVALLLRWLGPRVLPSIERYLGWLTLLFVALLIAGFWLVGFAGRH